MAYDFMPVNEQHIPLEIKSAITMHKPYRPMNGNINAGTIKLDNGSEYFIQPDVRTNGFIAKRVYETDEDENDLVLRGWGKYNEYDHWFRQDERLFNWLDHQFRYELEIEIDNLKWMYRLRAFQPMRSKIASGKVAVYLTQQQRDDDRQVAMRPGRAFSAMFPELPHKNIISLVDKFLQEFAERDFNLHVSQEADAFTLAYSGRQSPAENIHTSCNRKHSSHSCMRYDFDDLPVHPVTAYASGDFEVIYATDQNGDIAARCVVYLNEGETPSAGPIYGVSEQALDFIHNHMIGKGYSLSADWEGARLKRIPYGDGEGFIAPYLDPCPQKLYDNGTHLVVSRDGEVDASTYRGVLNDYEYRCCECGEGLCEDDYYYSECTDNHYCESCHNDTHFYCEYEGQSYHESEATDAYYLYNGSVRCERVSRIAVEYRDEFVYCSSDDEYWKEEDTFWCEYDGEHIDPKTYDRHYFRSEWDCEVYPNNLMCTTEDGEVVSTEEIDDDLWHCVKGVWYKNDKDTSCRKENK